MITNFGYSIAIVGIVDFQHSNSDFTTLRVPDPLVHVVPSMKLSDLELLPSPLPDSIVFSLLALVRTIFYITDSKHSWNVHNIRTDARYR